MPHKKSKATASTKIPPNSVQNDPAQGLLAAGPQDPPEDALIRALLGGTAGWRTGGPEPCPPAPLLGPQSTLLVSGDQPPHRSCAASANAGPPPVSGGRDSVHGSSRGSFSPLAENELELIPTEVVHGNSSGAFSLLAENEFDSIPSKVVIGNHVDAEGVSGFSSGDSVIASDSGLVSGFSSGDSVIASPDSGFVSGFSPTDSSIGQSSGNTVCRRRSFSDVYSSQGGGLQFGFASNLPKQQIKSCPEATDNFSDGDPSQVLGDYTPSFEIAMQSFRSDAQKSDDSSETVVAQPQGGGLPQRSERDPKKTRTWYHPQTGNFQGIPVTFPVT